MLFRRIFQWYNETTTERFKMLFRKKTSDLSESVSLAWDVAKQLRTEANIFYQQDVPPFVLETRLRAAVHAEGYAQGMQDLYDRINVTK